MANIKIQPTELSSGVAKTITLKTKDTYVLEDIDVIVKPQAGSFNNAPTTGVTYTENTADNTILPEEGYLYLNKGWFNDTKISLGHLIPDDVNYPNAGVAHILSGYEAYDTDGTKLIGTMATVTPKFDGGGLTVTPSVTGLTAPTVTVSSSGTFKTSTTFGVTTTKPSGTDGTSYLTIDGTTSKTEGSVKAKATYSRAAVLYNGATTGYIDKADNTEALAATTEATATTAETTITPTVTDNFAPLYIPIVSVKDKGTGGGVTKIKSGDTLKSIDDPYVLMNYSGAFTDTTGREYGVITTAPTGVDGRDYLKMEANFEKTSGSVGGKATISYNRAKVTTSANIKGAISDNIGTEVASATTGYLEHDLSLVTSASVNINGGKYYIPIIKSMPVLGGGLSQGASSVSIAGTNPTVTIKKSGAFTDVASGGVGTSYGVTTIAPTTGTDGTNFLKITIDGLSDTQTFTGSSKIYVSRADVTHNGAAAGAIKWTDGSSILAAISNKEFTATTDTNTQKSVTASVTGGTSYYIPIVSLTNKGTGGTVTASATASISSITNPSMGFNTSGSIITDGLAAFGISHSEPVGTGEEFYSLIIKPSITTGSISGTISGTWTRTAVKSNGAYKGAVNLTTNTQFLAEDSGTFDGTNFSKTDISVNINAITEEDKNWYFTKATLGNITGGGLSAGKLLIKGNTPYVTPDISFLSRTGSTDGSAITLSTYGIIETAPTEGEWVVFDPTGTPTGAEYTGSVNVTRNAASVNVSKGLTTGETKNLTSESKTYTGKTNITPGVKDGTNRYIPVQEVSATVTSHNVTNPTVNCSEETRYFINGTAQTSTPLSGILVQASNPSDFNTKSYIKIAPSYTTVKGSSSVTAKASISAGITKGGEKTYTGKVIPVTVVKGTSEYCFIKVYDGTYSVK